MRWMYWGLVALLATGCLPAEEALDGGRGDAGRGAPDAAVVDAGGDAARPDAARPDAALTDAAPADAAPADAGEADGGEADAARPDAGPPGCPPAHLALSQATLETVEIELTVPGLRSASRLRLGRTETATLPIPAGRTRLVARTGTGEAPLVLLDRELDLACGQREAVVVGVPAERFLPPVARAYTLDNQRPPADPPPFTCGEDKARATFEESFDDDGNLLVRLGCFRPDNAARQLQRLELTFAAEAVARSYSLHRLRRTFALYLAVPGFTHFQVEAAGAGFHPQVGGTASPPAGPPGGPAITLDAVPGGEIAWLQPAQTLDGVEVVPGSKASSLAMAVPSPAQPRTLWYRGFAKLPGDRFRVQWSLSPTAPGKLFVDQTCHDLPPPADLLAEEVVQGAMVDDPLFDEATLTLPIPAQATPQTRWVRLTRLGPGDAPAACPTPWISLVFSTSPGVAAACPDGSPVAPWGCGDPPPADPETGFVVDDLVYEPLLTERDPDFYMTLDAYITIPRSCLMDDDCPIGEQCLGGDCTMFGGQVCDPACVGPANPFGWPEGCVYRLSQHPPPEASGPSFFEIVFGAIVTVWEYLAAGWNALVQGLVIAISVAIPGCEAACDDVPGNMACDENWCGSLVASVVHGAFVALGLPPHAPSFEQLVDEGVDYVASLGAESLQDATGIPSAVSEPAIKEALKRVVAEAKEQARTQETADPLDPRSWGTPSPWHNRHPARVRLRLRRTAAAPTTSFATLRGGALFFDRLIALPQQLNAGQVVTLTVLLEPRIYPPIGQFYDPDVLFWQWHQQAYQAGAATLDLRVMDRIVAGVPAGDGWPGPVSIPTCE